MGINVMHLAKRGLALFVFCDAMLLAGCASTSGKHMASKPPAFPQRPRNTEPEPAVPARPVAAINANLSADEALWHVRSALNVAALSCRTRSGAGVASAYNHMLQRHKAMLVRANAAETGPFRARYGAKWAGPYDAHATKLYNFFAMPTAQERFCMAASQVLAKINTTPPDAIPAYAPAALAQLEAPFLRRSTLTRR